MSVKVRMNEGGSWIDKHGPAGKMAVIAREGQEVVVSDTFAENLSKVQTASSVSDRSGEQVMVCTILTREVPDPIPVNDVGPKAKAERVRRERKKKRKASAGKTVAIPEKPSAESHQDEDD
jgi:hypothetical protein